VVPSSIIAAAKYWSPSLFPSFVAPFPREI